jgi:hypothetical protein
MNSLEENIMQSVHRYVINPLGLMPSISSSNRLLVSTNIRHKVSSHINEFSFVQSINSVLKWARLK